MRRKTITLEGIEYEIDQYNNVKVDAYRVPLDDAPAYVAMRERYASIALELFAKHYASAERDFAGSEDGEAVVALNEEGLLERFFYLDPATLEAMKEAEADGKLEEFLLTSEN